MRLGIGIVILMTCAVRVSAQQGNSRCTGNPPDSLWLAAGPVYRDCEVDKKAKQSNKDPDLDPDILKGTRSDSRCLGVELEFVVDTGGQSELSTVRTRSTDSPALEQAVLATLAKLRFAPARLADRPVRQLVVYKRSVSTLIPFTVRPLGKEPPPTSRPLTLPRC